MATATKTKKSAPARPKLSLDELLGRVDKKAKSAPATPKVKDRPAMDLSDDAKKEFTTLVGYDSVFKKIETRYVNQKDHVSELLFNAWTEYVWNNKCLPTKNPGISTKEDDRSCKGIFQVQKRYKFDFPAEIPEDQSPEDMAIELLTQMGVKEENAMEIVSKELDFTPKRGVKNINDVLKEEGGEDAVQRFLTMCYTDADNGGTIEVEPLTDEDRDLLFYNSASIVVLDGFLDRLSNYVESLDELRAVLRVIKPVSFPSHMALTSAKEAETLKQISAEMLGV